MKILRKCNFCDRYPYISRGGHYVQCYNHSCRINDSDGHSILQSIVRWNENIYNQILQQADSGEYVAGNQNLHKKVSDLQ